MRRQEKRLTAGRPIGPHQPLTYWRELHPFFGVEIRETELAAGESQRVLGNEIFNLTLGLRIERLVSGSHGSLEVSDYCITSILLLTKITGEFHKISVIQLFNP